MIVEWLPAALADLRAAIAYLDDRNARLAANTAADILRASDSLGNFHIAAALVARQIRGSFREALTADSPYKKAGNPKPNAPAWRLDEKCDTKITPYRRRIVHNGMVPC